MTSRKASFVKGALWIGGGRIFVAIIGFISTVILARLLAPADFGLVAIGSAAVAIISVVADMPLSHAVIHHDEPEDEHFHTIWNLGLIKGLGLAALIAGSAPFLADLYGDQRLTNILLVLAATALLGSLQNPLMTLFERDLVFWQSVLISLTDRITSFVVSVAIAWIYQSYWAIVLGVLAAAFVRLVLSYAMRPYRPRFSLSKARELLSFSIWLTLGSWIHAIAFRADPLLLGYFVKPSVLGYYSMGNRISQMSIGQLVGPVSSVLFPALARMKHDTAKLRAAYLRVQAVSCSVGFPAGAGFAALAGPIVALVLGDQWLPAIPVIQVLVLMAGLQTIEFLFPLALATGETKALFRRQLQALVIRVPLLVAGILIGQATELGVLMGAVLGMAVSQGFMALWQMGLIKRISGAGFRAQFRGLLRPAIASAGMVAVLLAASAAVGPIGQNLQGYATLLALITLGAIAYLVFLLGLWLVQGRPAGPETELLQLYRQTMAKMRSATG